MIDTGDAVVKWVCEGVPDLVLHGKSWGIGLTDAHENRVAGVVYEDYNGANVCMHQRIVGRLTPAFLWNAFHYPFMQLGCVRVTGLVPDDNRKALALNLHLGFEIEARLERARRGGDLIVMRMFRERCRFIRPEWVEKAKRSLACTL
jgi:hypothetical protein